MWSLSLFLVPSVIVCLHLVRIMQSGRVVETWAHRSHLHGVVIQRRRAPRAAGRRRPAGCVSHAGLVAVDSGHRELRRRGIRQRLLPAGRGAKPAAATGAGAGGGCVCELPAPNLRQQGKFLQSFNHRFMFKLTYDVTKTCVSRLKYPIFKTIFPRWLLIKVKLMAHCQLG